MILMMVNEHVIKRLACLGEDDCTIQLGGMWLEAGHKGQLAAPVGSAEEHLSESNISTVIIIT